METGAIPAGKHSNQFIMRTPATIGLFADNPLADQIIDVAKCGIGRRFRNFCPFRRGELAFESVEQFIQHLSLPFVQRRLFMGSQNSAFANTDFKTSVLPISARSRQDRNHSIHSVMSLSPCWVFSNIS